MTEFHGISEGRGSLSRADEIRLANRLITSAEVISLLTFVCPSVCLLVCEQRNLLVDFLQIFTHC